MTRLQELLPHLLRHGDKLFAPVLLRLAQTLKIVLSDLGSFLSVHEEMSGHGDIVLLEDLVGLSPVPKDSLVS